MFDLRAALLGLVPILLASTSVLLQKRYLSRPFLKLYA
jgi:hypothetical protein